MFINPICQKPLQAAYGDRAIQISSITLLFTRMVAYTTYGGGKGIIFFDHIEGFFISTSLD
jgi:Na+/proline symporter